MRLYTMAIPPQGQFETLRLDSDSIQMLTDAYNAVESIPGGWDYLKRPDIPPRGSFMFASNDATLTAIDGRLTYSGHSGSSYGWVMRTMETIAKNGWDVYVNSVGIRTPKTANEYTDDDAINYLIRMSADMDKPYVVRRMKCDR